MPERTSYAQGIPSWVDLSTPDPEAAQQFYGHLLGWEYSADEMGQGGMYYSATLNGKDAGGIMEQPPQQAAQGIPPMWNTYITVDDLPASLEKATASGGQVLMPVMAVMEAGEMAVIADPTGAPVALWQAKDSIGCQVVNEPGALVWNELTTDDVAKATEFFVGLFGWEIEEQEMPTGPYVMFKVGDEVVGGIMKTPAPGIPNHWATYFAVADIEASLATALEHGGQANTEIIDIGVGKFVALADPQGAHFMLMELAEPAS